MSGAFSAKVDISTREAIAGLRAARTEADSFGKSLNELDSIIRKNKGNLKLAADEFTRLVAAQRAATTVSKDMAKVKIDEARAQGIANVATAKATQLNSDAAKKDAEKARASAQTGLALARTTEATDRGARAAERHATSTRRAAQAQMEMHDSLSNSRYLMYDVGATYGVISAGLLAIPAATAAVAAAYQKDFAQVIRVNEDFQRSGEAAQSMKDSLKDLATDIPVAFGELSRITQLGSQMGVANDKLSAFTETTAKFVAVTGISADTGATLFGRMETSFSSQVAQYPDFFERLGSSIAYVGAKTVATDPEIAAMLNQIGPLGAAAGMSAESVTGLSAALASVRVRPELARGALTKVFANINRDVAEGSPRLAEYGKVMGITGDAAAKLWKTDSSKFFTDMIAGLNGTLQKNGELTTTLDKLGIKELRVSDALTKLAVGNDVLVKSMDFANQGFEEGTALNEMAKPVFETVVAKLTEMANAWQNLGDTLGSGALAPLGMFVDTAKNVAIWLRAISENADGSVTPIGRLLQMLMGFATITALFLGFKSAQAFVMAGMIGFQQAAARGMGGGLAMTGMMKTWAQTMLVAKGATDQQSRALLNQVSATRALIIATTTSSAQLRSGAAGSFGVLATATGRATGGIKGTGTALLGLAGGPVGIAIGALALLAGGFINAQMEAEQAGKSIAEAMQQGADSGRRAIAESLNNRKVQLSITEGDISFSKLGQSVSEVARQVDVSFEDIVNAVEGGTDSAAAFQKKMDDLKAKAGLDKFKADAYGWLGRVATEMANSEKTAAAGLKDVAKAAPLAGKGVNDAAGDFEDAVNPIDEVTKALKDLNDEVFGTINAQSALQAALASIGEGLQKSQSYSPTSEGGRQNLENLQDTLTKARTYYKQLVDEGSMSAQEAAQGYADFTTDLLSEIRNTYGGDTSYVQDLAETARAKFEAAIGGGKPVEMPLTTSTETVMSVAADTRSAAQQVLDLHAPTLKVGADSSEAQTKILNVAVYLSRLTGVPFDVVVDALTDPASEKGKELRVLMDSIVNDTYVAPVGADTSAAITNVKNFSEYAKQELANLQTAYNNVFRTAQTGQGFFKGSANVALGKNWDGSGTQTYFGPNVVATPTQTAPKVVAPTNKSVADPKQSGAVSGLDAIRKGYDKAAEAAKKAGKEAKKSAKDMADGISDAVAAAEDYGNRLKTALMSAYNQQYGLTAATDQYHSALNAITKKREDEIKQVEDLTTKIRELNDERDKELITANKAKIEQNISLKYGEGDRAADYGQQAKEALDNAAAKQKEIDASSKEATTIRNGIGLLTGYSDAAIANREALRSLETKTFDMIAAYAAQGHTTEEVRRYAQALTGQFQTDVGQMGFNMTAVAGLQGNLERYIDVVDRVPQTKPTDVELNGVDEATQELADFGSALDAIPDKKTIDVETRVKYGVRLDPAGDKVGDQPVWESYNTSTGGSTGIKFFNEGGLVPGQSPSDPRADNMLAKVDGKGLVGIRSREFIQPEPAVDYYGLDFMKAIQTMKLPKYFMGGSPSGRSSGGGSGAGVVDLSAQTLAALASILPDIKLYTENRLIAESANAGNKELASEGRS